MLFFSLIPVTSEFIFQTQLVLVLRITLEIFKRMMRPASFRQDFVEIANERTVQKKKKHDEELLRRNRISALKNGIYSKLIIACSDLVFGRRNLRMAFNIWLGKINLQPKAVVRPPNFTGLRRFESKYRAKETKAAEKDLFMQMNKLEG